MKLNLKFPAGKEFDAVGLGLTAIDHLITLPAFPERGTKSRLSHYEAQGGGQIGTGFSALARLGLKVKFLGKVGGDPQGELSLKLLQEEGVDTSHVVVEAEASTQFAFILVEEGTGERTILWHRHPALTFGLGDFPRPAVTAGRILHLDGHEVPFSIQAARWAREEGIPVLLDAERMKDGTMDLLPLADILISDERFCNLLCPGKSPEEFLAHLDREYHPVFCAVTLGERGSLGLFRGAYVHSPAFRVDVVDTTGAGDVYHAGFLYGALQNWEIPQIMRFAGAAAALKCRHRGGRKGAPHLCQVTDFLERQAQASMP
jgi:sugar/nucleoside kinase (ribokinase family)